MTFFKAIYLMLYPDSNPKNKIKPNLHEIENLISNLEVGFGLVEEEFDFEHVKEINPENIPKYVPDDHPVDELLRNEPEVIEEKKDSNLDHIMKTISNIKSKVDTVDSVVDSIETKVDSMTNALISVTTQATAGSTSTEIRTPLTDADDFYNEMLVLIINSGKTIARNIIDYQNTNGALIVAALPFTPSVSDIVIILNRLGAPDVGSMWDESLAGHQASGSIGEALETAKDFSIINP